MTVLKTCKELNGSVVTIKRSTVMTALTVPQGDPSLLL